MRARVIGVLAVAAAVAALTSSPLLVGAQSWLEKGVTAVTGVITDAQGVPVARSSVRFWRVYDDDSRVLQLGPSAVTDATGRYRMDGVPRGTYLVESFLLTSSSPIRPSAPSPDSVFYPGTSIANDARPLVVAGEPQITGIDIVRRLRSLPRISGRAVTTSGEPLQSRPPGPEILRGRIWLSHVAGSPGITFYERDVEPGADGTFTFDHVQPGNYVLNASLDGQPAIALEHSLLRTSRELAMQAVTVAGDDQQNIQLQLRSTRNVTGRLVIEGTAAPPPGPRAFAFDVSQTEPGLDANALRRITGAVSILENGALIIEGLVGAGRVTYSSGPKGWHLAAMRTADGRDVDGPITAALAEPLTLVVRDDAVTLAGALTGVGAASPQLQVALFPVDQTKWWGWPAVRTTQVFPDFPHYFFESVPPGEYFVAAYTRANAPPPKLDLQSRLTALSRVARRVVIPSRQHVALDLPLVVPGW